MVAIYANTATATDVAHKVYKAPFTPETLLYLTLMHKTGLMGLIN